VTKKKEKIVKDYNDMSTDKKIDIEITFYNDVDESIEGDNKFNKLEKVLKLYTSQSITNMHLFDSEEKLKKYESVDNIIDTYYDVRLSYYEKRKSYMINNLQKELKLLSNKAKYIQENLDGTIDLRKKTKEQILNMLAEKQFDKMDDDNDYKYLLKMSMDSVSDENVNKLMQEKGSKESKLHDIEKTSIEKMWLNDLEELERNISKAKK